MYKEYKETIEALPRLFAWHDGQAIFDTVHASGLDHAAARTQRALDHIGTIDPELAHSMRDCLEGLPQQAQARFMTAPETIERSMVLLEEKKPAPHISFLVNALMAERAVSGVGRKPARSCWTALGDFYFSGGQKDPVAESRDFQWEATLNFRAPVLGDSVPLDFTSPFAKATTPCRSPFQAYEPAQAQAACNALQDAFHRITSIPAPAQMISRFTKVMVLRKDVGGHSSSSMRTYPGRMLLRNPDTADAGELASSMIHESLHHFLYTVEFSGEFVESGATPRAISPWSGRDLALHSYLHACFVWYGLARFWHKQWAMEVFAPEIVNAQLARSSSGFRKGNPVDQLAPYAHLFRREVLDAASSLHEEVRKAGILDNQAQNVA